MGQRLRQLPGVHAVGPEMHDHPSHDLKLTAADLFSSSEPEVIEPDVPCPAPAVAPRRPDTGVRSANVLHVRVVTGAGGGPEKTILRSPRSSDPARYRMAAAYLYPEGDPGMSVIRQNARQLECPLYEIAEDHAFDHHSVGALLELCRLSA